ncbi:alpha/beta fold hydrolase [Sphingomonas sp. ASY06-1R]|uniref:alpha/beta fold hydrolase n=1 Tax=Sphingomonas sp. ASY06-1R TaxID=3445771 RepID=UPI003FA2A0B9
MASSPADFPVRHFRSEDGLDLVYRELGQGRPLILIHGLFSNSWVNWIRYGHAQLLAERGFRVIMPDLRGHGESAAPHDAASYPPDILAQDGLALVRHLGLTDYDLGGYSLGGRTTLRMLVDGAAPRRAILAGMGLAGILDVHQRRGFFRHVLEDLGNHKRGSGAWLAEGFLRTTGGDAKAMLPLLDSFVDTSEQEIAAITMPVLVLAGVDDHDNGSAADLAAILPEGRLAHIPGNHMTSVLRPELGQEIADFLLDQ